MPPGAAPCGPPSAAPRRRGSCRRAAGGDRCRAAFAHRAPTRSRARPTPSRTASSAPSLRDVPHAAGVLLHGLLSEILALPGAHLVEAGEGMQVAHRMLAEGLH